MAKDMFLEAIAEFLSQEQLITNQSRHLSYVTSYRGLFYNPVKAVLLPRNTTEVSKILYTANKYKQAIVPQGGNTGLVGGQQGSSPGQVIVSLKRMNNILNINKFDRLATVESGVILSDLHSKLKDYSLMFPLQLASQQLCQIGGNLASNAGGVAVLSYGSMRDLCMGIEVVLPDGSVVNDLRSIKKDNMGYNIKDLFIGSEGTLGIITKATLKLFPEVRSKETAYVAFSRIYDVLEFFLKAKQEFSYNLTSYELLSDFAMEIAMAFDQCNRNIFIDKHKWVVLLEISSFSLYDNVLTRLEKLLEDGISSGKVVDATIAQNDRDRAYFWTLRENLSPAQKLYGVSIKNDISLPLSTMPEFLKEASSKLAAKYLGTRIVCFGHIGDGNLHYNIMQPKNMAGDDFIKLWDQISEDINCLVHKYNGSIAAEHGVGQLKNISLKLYKDKNAYDLMRRLKMAIDPNEIMNPNKIFI